MARVPANFDADPLAAMLARQQREARREIQALLRSRFRESVRMAVLTRPGQKPKEEHHGK